jgi:oligoribonuclease (3'-5' exoribonuclease)
MATTTKMPAATHSRPGARTQATHQRGIPAAGLLRIPAARLGTVVERSAVLSDEMLTSVEEGQRAAIDAAGRFVVTIEEALPHEVQGTSEVAKTITESGLETADRLAQTWYDFLRKVIGSTAKSLSSGNGARPDAAR